MKYLSILVIAILALGGWYSLKNKGRTGSSLTNLQGNAQTANIMATIHTSEGDITFSFLESDAPKTVENFKKLASAGFYDGVRFHRVIKGFMIQTGDPQSKDDSKMNLWGTGGPGYTFPDEINASSLLYKGAYAKGTVAMANSGPNTNGSQFFIMTSDYPLPPLYTKFGMVTGGQDVVDKIANVETGENDRPIKPITIKSLVVIMPTVIPGTIKPSPENPTPTPTSPNTTLCTDVYYGRYKDPKTGDERIFGCDMPPAGWVFVSVN